MKDKTKLFIEKAYRVHGDKYDYSKVDYKNAITKVVIICPTHGEFEQTPQIHLRGCGCQKCWEERKSKDKLDNKESFVEKAHRVHGDKYDYSKVEYEKSNKKVLIICPTHGKFEQTPNKHLLGQGCPECGKKIASIKRLLTLEKFIEKARKVHSDKYDYSKVEYINSNTKVCIICPEHGEFWQTPHNHLEGKGCFKCIKQIYDRDSFIYSAKEVHGDKYDYSKVEYKGIDKKVCIICPIHGEFWQLPSNHIKFAHGCPKCNLSHLENEIKFFLESNKIDYVFEKKFSWLGKQSLDFYLPKYNSAIECQGRQHFENVDFFTDSLETIVKRDENKMKLCKENGVSLLYYSNLGIEYPYEVFEDKEKLLNEILNRNEK